MGLNDFNISFSFCLAWYKSQRNCRLSEKSSDILNTLTNISAVLGVIHLFPFIISFILWYGKCKIFDNSRCVILMVCQYFPRSISPGFVGFLSVGILSSSKRTTESIWLNFLLASLVFLPLNTFSVPWFLNDRITIL